MLILKRASVASNNDNVYKFINTAKKTSFIRFFALSECEYIFGITITVLKISQNNDNRGCHLEFHFHTGIGNNRELVSVLPSLPRSQFKFRFRFRFRLRFRIPAFPYARFAQQYLKPLAC